MKRRNKIAAACDGLDEISPITVFPQNPFKYYFSDRSETSRLNDFTIDCLYQYTPYLMSEIWKFDSYCDFIDE